MRLTKQLCIFSCFLLPFTSHLVAWQYVLTGPQCHPDNGEISFDQAHAIVTDANGDVIVAGAKGNDGVGFYFLVMKISGKTGKELWRSLLHGTCSIDGSSALDFPNAVAVDSNNDVIAAGTFANLNGPSGCDFDFGVVKISGRDGSVVWRHEIRDEAKIDMALSVVIDSANNVIAAGTSAGIAAIKLSGLTGEEMWRYASPHEFAAFVALDAAQDAIISGGVTQEMTSGTWGQVIAKLSGRDGQVLWKRFEAQSEGANVQIMSDGDPVVVSSVFQGDFYSNIIRLNHIDGAEMWRTRATPGKVGNVRVGLDANGDVYTAGHNYGNFFASKIGGLDGSQRWSNSVPGEYGSYFEWRGIAYDLSVDTSGDLVAAGTMISGSASEFAIDKFSGKDGALMWSRLFKGTSNTENAAWVMTSDQDNNVVAAGFVENSDTCRDLFVIKLLGETGEDFPPDIRTLLDIIRETTVGRVLQVGVRNSLIAKLDATSKALGEGDRESKSKARRILGAFLAELRAQNGKEIAKTDADLLAEEVEEVLTLL